MRKARIAALVATSLAMSAGATPAMAGTGCNGVVNYLVWHCAGWDNNNGPQFPYYKKTTKSIAVKRVEQSNGTTFAIGTDGQKYLVTPQDLAKAQSLIPQDGGGLIGNAGGALVGNAGGTLTVYTGG